MDFTIKTYELLLRSFISAGYSILGYSTFIRTAPQGKYIILRHDVDELPTNALKMARIENKLGIRATYYFRIVRKSNAPEIIKEIVSLGHEIGYHYEDLATASGDFEKAISSFSTNLDYFRTFYPVNTVCMHGSSSSSFDNKSLWSRYNLSDFGIIGEPYLSTDFSKIFYLSDTGYSWDGKRFAVRDFVNSSFDLTFKDSKKIIAAVLAGGYPEQSMILAHTLWTDSFFQWYGLHLREFFRNRVKMIAKKNKAVAYLYNKIISFYWKR